MAGRPYRGAFGMSGELGHIVSFPEGRPCPCGNKGCLERYVSLSAAHAAVTGQPETFDPIQLGVLQAAFEAGDGRFLRWLDEASGHLRNTIVTIENLFDPQAVILGGLIPDAILSALISRIEPLPTSVSNRPGAGSRRLLKAESGLDTRALGATSEPRSGGKTCASTCRSRWSQSPSN